VTQEAASIAPLATLGEVLASLGLAASSDDLWSTSRWRGQRRAVAKTHR